MRARNINLGQLTPLSWEGKSAVVECDGCVYVFQAAIAREGSFRNPAWPRPYNGIFMKWRAQKFDLTEECCDCDDLKVTQVVAEFKLGDTPFSRERFTPPSADELDRQLAGADDADADHPHWAVDSGGTRTTPFWDDPDFGLGTSHAETGRGAPAVLRDAPGRFPFYEDKDGNQIDRQKNHGMEFFTLLMCHDRQFGPEGTKHTAYVVANISWGFYFDEFGKRHVDLPQVRCGSTAEADEALRRWRDHSGGKNPFSW